MKKKKSKTYTLALSVRDVDYCWTTSLPSDAFMVPSKHCTEEKTSRLVQMDRCRRFIIVDTSE
jgi:hypothetical protein